MQVVSLADGTVVGVEPGRRAATRCCLRRPETTPVHGEVTGVVAGEPDRYVAVALRTADGTSYVVVARSLESVDAATSSTTGLFVDRWARRAAHGRHRSPGS